MPTSRPSREDIVVTGISCRFAGSPDPATFWQNILQRKALFTPFRLLETQGALPRKNLFDRTQPGYAAQLADLYAYDPADVHLSRSINTGENPELLFAIQLIIDALRDSNLALNALPTDQISLRLGYPPPFNAAAVNWLQHTVFLDQTVGLIRTMFPLATTEQLSDIRDQLTASLPTLTPYAFMSSMGGAMASWIAHLLGFASPSQIIECGSLSAHFALQSAMDDLRMRRADIAIAGAIQPPFTLAMAQALSGMQTFSTSSRIQPFSRTSDGTLPGEGGAIFVLKRLKDAERQNDRIYALIRSSEIASASLETPQKIPTPKRLRTAIDGALDTARLSPEAITYIEAHGCGVPYTDQTEAEVLTERFGPRQTARPLVGIGAVKGNIGHALWGSGAASFLKAILAIYHRVLPPNCEIEKPCTALASAKSSLYLINETRPWTRGNKKMLRRAGITSIDFTGACAAAIIEEYPEVFS